MIHTGADLEKIELQEQIRQARKNLPLKNSKSFYCQNLFASNEDREKLRKIIFEVKVKSKKLYSLEEKKEENRRALIFNIGKRVHTITLLVKKYNQRTNKGQRVNLTKYLQLQFPQKEISIKRLIEYRSMYCAQKHTKTKLSVSHGITLGQSLNSRSIKKRRVAKKALKESTLCGNHITEFTSKELINKIREISSEETLISILKSIQINFKSLKQRCDKISNCKIQKSSKYFNDNKDEIYKLINSTNSILLEINTLFEKTTEKIIPTGKWPRNN